MLVSEYGGEERRHGTSNDDISEQLAAFREEIRDYVNATFVTKAEFRAEMDRQTGEITRSMSTTLNVFVKDSIREIFAELYVDQRKQDRQEMIQSFATLINKTSTVARILQPLFTIAGVLFGMWITGNT